MGTLFLLLILVGVVLTLVSAGVALRAYLGFRRARMELQNILTAEVTNLAQRTGELEAGISTLQTRAARLPLTIAELQHSLATLQVLTRTLAVSLGQARKVLAYDALASLDGTALGRVLRRPADRGGHPS